MTPRDALLANLAALASVVALYFAGFLLASAALDWAWPW